MPRPRFLQRSFAIPSTHGSWVWWLGPFAIGTAAGGAPGGDVAALFVAGLAGFLLHHPAGIAVKALTGRRAPRDLAPAVAWIAIYTLVAVSALPCLVMHGHARVLWLLFPGGLVFAGHLVLVARRLERRRMGVEMLEAGVLALAAPAAYVVAGGPRDVEAWVLWALCWVQTAGAIANVFVQLPPRRAPGSEPSVPGRRSGTARVSLALQALGLAVAAGFAAAGEARWETLVPFGIVALEACANVARPAAGRRPAQVGVRQLVVSLLFVAGMIAAWRLG